MPASMTAISIPYMVTMYGIEPNVVYLAKMGDGAQAMLRSMRVPRLWGLIGWFIKS